VFPGTSYDPICEGLPAGGGLTNHRKIIADFPGVLDVVAVVSNPCRYRSRYDLYRAFERQMHASGVRLTTVELAFGQRPWEVTKPGNPRHVQLRTNFELWHKENLINLGVQRLPRDWRYVAWIDADVTFARPDWAQETLHQLQHHPVVQLFSEALDLDSVGHPMARYRSFGWSHIHGVPRKPGAGYHGGTPQQPDDRIAYYHHPGFAWAMRRDAIEAVGGLFDQAVVGEADFIMARAIVGEAEKCLYPGVTHGYRAAVLEWQDRAKVLRRDLGYVPGTLLHYWHGPKAKRNYWDRCRILSEGRFDPAIHLARDWQGLYRWVDRGDQASLILRDKVRAYFRSRDEDATL
jgi:hypothetical protein